MAERPIEIVGRIVTAFSRGDLDGFLALFDPECDVVFESNVPEPGPFHGRDELRGWAERFVSAWKQPRAELEEVVENGDRVYALIRTTTQGASSGIEGAFRNPFVFTIRDGLVVSWSGFAENEVGQARAAAGLSA